MPSDRNKPHADGLGTDSIVGNGIEAYGDLPSMDAGKDTGNDLYYQVSIICKTKSYRQSLRLDLTHTNRSYPIFEIMFEYLTTVTKKVVQFSAVWSRGKYKLKTLNMKEMAPVKTCRK